jgi:uncharacterized protein YhdP
LRSADLRVEKLLFSEAALHEVNLDLTRKTAGWSARFDATEVAGRLFLPHRPRSRPLRIDLDRLDLEPLFAEPSAGDAGSAVPARAHPDPRRSHTLDLSADRLHWGENQIGRLTLAADASDDGLRFREIGLDGGSLLQVSGSGRWTVGAGGPTTLIDLKADTEDLGNLLRQLGYESLLDQAPAEVELRLRWPGSPGAFSVQELGGRAVAEIKEGSLLDVDPGVGRMLGVFNLGALNRRLSLDFRDLFGPGYAFERISGKMALHRGQAEIEEMTIEGPSAEVRIEGKTDLVKQEFEQVVTVTPHLGTGVALASAVAGGPLVGAAVLIADKVSGGAVDKIGQYQYDVTGPWTNPSIERRPFLETRAEESVFPAEHGRAGARRASEEKPPGSGGEEPAGAAVPKRIRQDVGPNLFLDP